MPRRRPASLVEIEEGPEPRPRSSRRAPEPDEEPECLFCVLLDEADDEARDADDESPDREADNEEVDAIMREKLAIALAYGSLVHSQGHGIAMCTDCNVALEEAVRDVKKELRSVRRSHRRARD
jgi:hypothetical protein